MEIPVMKSGHCGTTTTVLLLLLMLGNYANAFYRTAFPQDDRNQFLAPQNAARISLGELPLVWDRRLQRYAEWYASQRREDCSLTHSDGPYGENIFWGGGEGWAPGQAVADWLSEGRWYNHWTNTCEEGKVCGHYTQIVWSTTTRVGCAKVTCDGGAGVFMTCNYDPPGNYMGEKPY